MIVTTNQMTTLNETAFCETANQIDFIGFCILMPIYMCVLAVFICGGNLLTIIAVSTSSSLQTTPNMYIVSLAVADLIVGVNVLFESFWYNALTEGLISDCKFCCLSNLCSLYTSLFASMANVVLIAVDRFTYICYPFHYERIVKESITKIIIIVTWVVSLILGTIPFYLNTFDEVQECTHNGVLSVWYQIYFEEIIFAFVLICCVFLYAGIVNIARSQLKSIQATTVDLPANSNMKRKNWKVIRLMLLVCGGFFVCWCPYHVCMVINHVSYVSEDIMDVLFPLGILNSGINFVIYALMNNDFRKAFRKRISCKRGRNHESSEGTSGQATFHLSGHINGR